MSETGVATAGGSAAPSPIVAVPRANIAGANEGGTPGPTLIERLERAVGALVVLRVTTVVGTVTAEGADDLNQVTRLRLAGDGQQVASSSINTMLGDCSTILSPIFVENAAYKELHASAVAKAQEVRSQTIALLKEAFTAFKDQLHL